MERGSVRCHHRSKGHAAAGRPTVPPALAYLFPLGSFPSRAFTHQSRFPSDLSLVLILPSCATHQPESQTQPTPNTASSVQSLLFTSSDATHFNSLTFLTFLIHPIYFSVPCARKAGSRNKALFFFPTPISDNPYNPHLADSSVNQSVFSHV